MKKIIFLPILLILLLSGCKKSESSPQPTTPEPNYTNFKILSVKISAMPFLDGNNTSWDPFDGPDVFFNIEDSGGNVYFNGTSSRINDVSTNGLPLTWNLFNAYQITNLSVTEYITVYDYDTLDPNDQIGYVGFTMQDHKSGYPKIITKTNGALTITITGEWY